MAKSEFERYKSWYYREVRKQAKATLPQRMSDEQRHKSLQTRMKTIRELSPMLSKEEYNTRFAENRDLIANSAGIRYANIDIGIETGLATYKFPSLIAAIKNFTDPVEAPSDEDIKEGIKLIHSLQELDDDTLYTTLAGKNEAFDMTEDKIKDIYRALNYADTWKNIT